MDEQTSSVEVPVMDDGKTSDQILAEIEAAKARELDAESQRPADQPSDKTGDAPAPETDKQPQAEDSSQASEAGSTPTGKGKVDIDEWMAKKGFKSVQDMAKSLRNLEQELSKRGKTLDENVPMPPQAVISTQPRYAPPQSNIEQLAAEYNMTPEDFQRVVKLANDAADLKLRMAITPLASEVQRLHSELRKEKVNKELESDPTFRNRAVMKEMYQIMESDPSVQNSPEPLKAAYDKALISMGRRFVEGLETSGTDQETRLETPTSPPPTGKSGQGTPRTSQMKTIAGKMTPEKFNSLSASDMEKYLSQHGMVRKDFF